VIEIRTGSDSDIPKIKAAHDMLSALGVPFRPRVLSAHRTPELMASEARALEANGVKVSIAAAGGAAHLPGMTASETLVPVVGIPVPTEALGGVDSLYSILQMPDGCPVGTVGIGQAEAAAILAAEIVALGDAALADRLRARKGLSAPAAAARLRTVAVVGNPGPRADPMLELLRAMGLSPVQTTEGAAVVIAFRDAPAIAARTIAPVIAVPTSDARGGVELIEPHLGTAPVAGMGINRVKNAALYAALIVGVHDPEVRAKARSYREGLRKESEAKDARLRASS